jgi:hypothetical protein
MEKRVPQKKVGTTVVLVLKSWRFYVSSIANCIVASCECGEFTEPDAHGWLQAMEGRGGQQEPLRLHTSDKLSSVLAMCGRRQQYWKNRTVQKKSHFTVAMVF